MCCLANFTLLLIGMDISFTAVSYQTIVKATDGMALSENEFSWIGKIC